MVVKAADQLNFRQSKKGLNKTMKKYLTYTEEEILEAVKQDGYALQFVKNQNEKICLEAVKQDGYALQFVENYYQSVADITNEEDYNSLKKAN